MFTAKLIPNSDQIVCNDVATVTIKDNDGEFTLETSVECACMQCNTYTWS